MVQPGQSGTFQRHRRAHLQVSGIHCHDFYEIFWVEKGPGGHWINGEEQLLTPGTVQLIRPEDNHTFFSLPSTVLEWTNVAFFPESWTALSRRYFPEKLRYFDIQDWKSRLFFLGKEQLSELRLAAAALNRGERSRLAFEQFLLNALSLLPGPLLPRSSPPAWLSELRQELQQQVNFSNGAHAVVAHAGRCPEHVCREFRKHFGCTPTAAMAQARMDYAAHLLSETDIKIVDLALEIGLHNLGHFYRSFAGKFGCTPRRYRMRQRQGKI